MKTNSAELELAREWDLFSLPAVIAEELPSGKLDLIDGHHRLATARARGYDEVNAVVVTAAELNKCAQFGSGEMSEPDWINWIESRHNVTTL